MLNKPLTLEEQKHLQAVQAWYEPAMYLFNQIYQEHKANLRKRGDDESKAAVNKKEFQQALVQRHRRLNEYTAREIQVSLCKAGKLALIGENYLVPVVEADV